MAILFLKSRVMPFVTLFSLSCSLSVAIATQALVFVDSPCRVGQILRVRGNALISDCETVLNARAHANAVLQGFSHPSKVVRWSLQHFGPFLDANLLLILSTQTPSSELVLSMSPSCLSQPSSTYRTFERALKDCKVTVR
ncbi:hypothetical protein BKA63DRAFT_507815 [Paraphoma chrysanthemicola]|jgi:hypothetical protein|nr:hypothetical protein BKA63DRAFT_507815 [Paraphoma chrysanthemicola]